MKSPMKISISIVYQTQFCQRFAIVATFLQKAKEKDEPPIRDTLRRAKANIRKKNYRNDCDIAITLYLIQCNVL